MNNLPEKTVIGSLLCPGCEQETELKINAKGRVYFHCMRPVERDPQTGKTLKQCRTGVCFSQAKSDAAIQEYLNKEGEGHAGRMEHWEEERSGDATEIGGGESTDTGNRNSGCGKPAAAAGGLGAKLTHFLTGDE